MNKRRWEEMPALLAVALFILAELLRHFKILSQNWDSIEIITNALMIGIAMFFSARELVSAQEQPPSSHRVVWIVSIPLLAFPMNIDVFKHAIRLGYLQEDLWSWHGFWIAFAVLQLLVLTPLGKEILKQMKRFLAQIAGILRWGKGVAVRMGNILPNLLDQILDLLKASSKKMIFIIILGLVLWACWLGVQIHGQNIRVLLTDVTFIGKNLLVWIDYLLTAMLCSLFPLVTRKAKEGILSLNARHMLAIVVGVTGLAASAFLLPFLISVVWAMIVLIGELVVVVKWAAKKDRQKFDEKDEGDGKTSSSEEPREKDEPAETSVRTGDMMVVLVFFAAAPLCVLVLLALFAFFALGEQELTSMRPLAPASWLELCKTMIEFANEITQLVGIR